MTHDQDLHDHEVEAHDLGLSHDLPTLLSRRRDPGGDGRAVSRRRLQRGQRAHRVRGRAQRHHPQLRLGVGGGRGRAPDHQAHGARHRQRRRPAAGRRRLPVALRPGGPLLAVLRGVTQENYLRGVQETGSDGTVTFTSIFPAACSGRWPHVHFEVYPAWTRPPPPAASSAPPSWRSPRTPAGRSTPPTAMPRASRTWPGPRLRPIWCSATATRCSWPR
jgi:hypothetical protein